MLAPRPGHPKTKKGPALGTPDLHELDHEGMINVTTQDIVSASAGPRDECGSVHQHYGVCVGTPAHTGEHVNAKGENFHNYGPPDRYELTWTSGHVEYVEAHQVMLPEAGMAFFQGGSMSGGPAGGPPRVHFHADVNGRWVLVLSALEADIRSLRLVTGDEQIPGGAL